jgi:hypothetical protein
MTTLFDTIENPVVSKAVERAWNGADPEWIATATAALKAVCESKETFTADDLDDVRRTAREPRALGPLLKIGQKNGWCEPTATTVKSTSQRNHLRRIAVWKSLITGGQSCPRSLT